jgi:hypothetical protein
LFLSSDDLLKIGLAAAVILAVGGRFRHPLTGAPSAAPISLLKAIGWSIAFVVLTLLLASLLGYGIALLLRRSQAGARLLGSSGPAPCCSSRRHPGVGPPLTRLIGFGCDWGRRTCAGVGPARRPRVRARQAGRRWPPPPSRSACRGDPVDPG